MSKFLKLWEMNQELTFSEARALFDRVEQEKAKIIRSR